MKGNKLLPGIEVIGLAVWIEPDKALVIADLHLGIEEMLNRQGVMLPRFNFRQTKKTLEKIFQKVKPETIIINGDLKHEFGSISEQEWSEVIDMLRSLQQHCKKIVLIKGNHDTILGPIAKWENLKIENEGVFLKKSSAFVTHGETIPKSALFKKAKTVVIGHEHPAITIREQYKREQFKCFLVGKFKGKNLIVQPSMNTVSIGTDVRKQQLLSPFLQQSLGSFKVFAVADKVYDFGKLGELQ
ncbi:MAG: metallophosphoesterase [Candidatus Diapherotrites archaeon]|nr:metallophosphoesterase [Candidatus Diapherotrites archaeon]